jgi:hypothetical protein
VRPASGLVLGPLLRYTGESDATVWVETDTACEVEVLGHRASTFEIEGHYYALVRITELEAGRLTSTKSSSTARRSGLMENTTSPLVLSGRSRLTGC